MNIFSFLISSCFLVFIATLIFVVKSMRVALQKGEAEYARHVIVYPNHF
jgi:hypothetical protein